MANVNDPNGFTPAYHLTGGTIRPAQMRIASATNAAIYSGDVVNLSSGYIIQGTATGAPVEYLLAFFMRRRMGLQYGQNIGPLM